MEYDYIIIGAGSAGCVLANRLSEDPSSTVHLIEAGPEDRSLLLKMPAALSYPLANDRFNWFYSSEPEAYLDGRRLYCPRGRVLGGSSSINGMAYVRGHALDYDRWASQGLDGWDYASCLPYFKKSQNHELGANDYRGEGGPLNVKFGPMSNPLNRAWTEAGQQAGYAYTDDMNGFQQEGVGPMEVTIQNGERHSTSKAFLDPVRNRRNLSISTRTLVTMIVFEGQRAVIAECLSRHRRHRIRARREIILCGGAINSPQILMLSGIGPADHLKAHGIPLVHDSSGVGENLHDHLEVYIQYECTKPVSLYGATMPWNKMLIGIEWLLSRKGLGAGCPFEAGGFVRSNPDVPHPDLQFHFLPLAVNYDGTNAVKSHGFQAHAGSMRPTSRGHVRLKASDPRTPPSIRFNYLATGRDREDIRSGVKIAREIINQPAFDPYRGRELSPGSDVTGDDEIDAFVRRRAESAYHPVGTCKMGYDEASVVDGQGRVHGIEGLRVVDASIMSDIVSGNINAPVIMMAEKIADMVLDRQPLPPERVPVFDPSNGTGKPEITPILPQSSTKQGV